MQYRLVVWREAGNYGASGGFEPQKNLGTHSMPRIPEEGDVLVIRGEDWKVTRVETGYLFVRPLRMKIS